MQCYFEQVGPYGHSFARGISAKATALCDMSYIIFPSANMRQPLQFFGLSLIKLKSNLKPQPDSAPTHTYKETQARIAFLSLMIWKSVAR